MMNHNACPTSARGERRAFTLTELLVVIAIIAVLAAMGSWGVMQALATAKQSRIKLEVDQLDAAFRAYKDTHGSYPPCDFRGLAGSNLLRAHIARAFPRYDISNGVQFRNELQLAGVVNEFRPDQALVFWLKGFSPDPAHPFVTPNGEQIINGMVPNPGVKVQITKLYDFDVTRLQTVPADPSKIPSYFPQGSKTDDTGAPYVYWEASSYPAIQATLPANALIWNCVSAVTPNKYFTNAEAVRPYAFDSNGNGSLDLGGATPEQWANPETCQIIAAGPDGRYSAIGAMPANWQTRLFPTGTYYDPVGADDDNVTNFTPKARLGDAKP
jgi:prepilin-type N-terminal cleavage/methylation domain-containing protein